ncbi:MAG TPA: response regulator [Verrucomicrobiae bacterium]|jgi:two-component system KDP operon response regulator KdpE
MAIESKNAAPNARKILVVDDNQVVLKAMTLLLSNRGYQVLVAATPEETIFILGRQRPDLILLDLDFPPDPASALADGFLTIEWARRYGIAPGIPVFIVSSLEPEKYKARAEAAGISTLFRKPVDERKLLEAIRAELNDAPPAQAA